MSTAKYSLEESVQHNLYNISKFFDTMEAALKQYIGWPSCNKELFNLNILDEIFKTSTDQFDFACYVYFEYCAGEFIKQDSFKTVQEHADYLINSDYNQSGAKGFLYDKYYSDSGILRRNLCRHIKKMIEDRGIYLPMIADKSDWNALISLLGYGTENIEDRMAGIPIGRCYVYQALTDIFVLNRIPDLYAFLSNEHTSTKDMNAFFTKHIPFIRQVLLEDYKENFTEDQCRDYIAKAINLVKLEDRKKLNTLYRFSYDLANLQTEKKNNWELIHAKCSMGPIPPIFSDSVVPWSVPLYGVPWAPEEFRLRIIFNFIRILLSKVECPPHCPSQIAQYEYYMAFFLQADTDNFHYEELRFYIIQMMAQYFLYVIKKGEIELSYSKEEYAYFIRMYYNVFEEYRSYIDFREKHPLTKQMAAIIRKTAAEMHLPDSPKTDP